MSKRLFSALAILFIGSGQVWSQQPQITITDLPTYGTSEDLGGVVQNVDPTAHFVCAYLFLEGGGWWTKPTFSTTARPLTPAAPGPST